MLDNICESLVQALTQAGIQAGRAYPRESISGEGVFVKVAIHSARQSDSGFARFMGLTERASDGALTEVYGMRCEMALALDIYASMESENGAVDCEKAVDALLAALAEMKDLKISSVSASAVRPDADTGMFLCRCQAQAVALLTLERDDSAGEFTDFILKGELKI